MKKSTKGALASGAAAVLLLGGAGSLAFWSDSVTVGGGNISSGHLSLDDTTSGTCAAAPWTLDGGTTFNPATGTIVPGDTLTKVCTFDVNAVGNHLTATLAATGGTQSGDLASATDTTAVFTVGGNTVSQITSADHGQQLRATITLDFPYGEVSDNGSQDDELEISDYTVTATQVHN